MPETETLNEPVNEPVSESMQLKDAIELGLFEPSKVAFRETSGGFLSLTYDGKEYKRVVVRRAMPLQMPNEYLSIADDENNEIGILRSLDDLDDAARSLVSKELSRRYYSPRITEVKSVKDQLGYVYFGLVIKGDGDSVERLCAVKDVNRNIRMLSDDSVIMLDVDGNRYIIPSLKMLSAKSRKHLEPYLF